MNKEEFEKIKRSDKKFYIVTLNLNWSSIGLPNNRTYAAIKPTDSHINKMREIENPAAKIARNEWFAMLYVEELMERYGEYGKAMHYSNIESIKEVNSSFEFI